MKKTFLSFFIGVCVYTLGLPLFASASGGVFFLTFNPEYPASNEDVDVRLKSTAVNVESSHIIWYINGDVQKEGVGQTRFSFHTGPAGTSTVLDIVIIAPNGQKYREQQILRPLDVDFLWEANTYTPPFYKGKARPTFQSIIRATAIPFFGTNSNPAAYVYDWTLGSSAGIGKGLGKNSAQVPAAWPKSNVKLGVHVASLDGGENGKKELNILSIDPIIRFYEDNPLSGVNYNKALTVVSASSTEYRMRAVPFFFGNEDRDEHKLIYTWRLNERRIAPGSDPETVSLISSGGASNLSLLIENARRVLQVASGEAKIITQ